MNATTITKLLVISSIVFLNVEAYSADQSTFKEIGKITEEASDHTTEHEHKLKFIRLRDGAKFDITDSPQLLKAHCESEKDPVVEIEGYRTDRFLFWGGDLVVTNFKIHEDIEVPRIAHANPEDVRVRPEPRLPRRG